MLLNLIIVFSVVGCMIILYKRVGHFIDFMFHPYSSYRENRKKSEIDKIWRNLTSHKKLY